MKFTFFAGLLLLLLLPSFVFAQTPFCSGGIGNCVSRVYIWSIGAAGLLALVMLIVGGYLVMTSGGNAQQASNGKSYITSSIVGLGLLLGAYFLLNTINPDLTNFNVNFDALNTTQQR